MVIHTSGPEDGPVDFKRHANDYTRLMSMLKWGGVASFIIAAVVVMLLAS